MKTLFVVDYWLPFPSSEYGGIQGFIALDKNDLYKQLIAFSESDISNYHLRQYPDYKKRIKKVVSMAQEFNLANDNDGYGLQFDFTT